LSRPDRETLPIEIKTAFEGLEEEQSRLKMTTGNSDLDSLVGGIEEGLFYLFYGEQEVLDTLIHKLIVNCIQPNDKGGFQAKGIYFNNTNYYTGKTILDPSAIGELAKHLGIDPDTVFSNIYAAAAYNEQRQLIVAKQVAELMEKDPEVKLLVIHNLTRFFADSKKPEETRQVLKQVISFLWSTASKRKIALVVTADAMNTSRGFIPRPVGGSFFRHVASVIVYLKKFKDGQISSVKTSLIKHPYKKTPDSIVMFVSKGGMDLMGRITPSFRQRYEETIGELKTNYQNSLIDLGHKQAFDLLLKEAWGSEQAAMGNSNLPTVVDALNITANIYNRKTIESLKRRLEEKEKTVEELLQRIQALEDKINPDSGGKGP
jgi:RecA/RadA recombinase